MEDRNADFIRKLDVAKTYFDEMKVVPRRVYIKRRIRELENE